MTRRLISTKKEQAHAEIRRRQLPLWLPHDILDFLLHYPLLDPADDPSLNANLKFYQNRQAARPRRANCEELQDELRGNWDQLEWRHDFVQWFFPIRYVACLSPFCPSLRPPSFAVPAAAKSLTSGQIDLTSSSGFVVQRTGR